MNEWHVERNNDNQYWLWECGRGADCKKKFAATFSNKNAALNYIKQRNPNAQIIYL